MGPTGPRFPAGSWALERQISCSDAGGALAPSFKRTCPPVVGAEPREPPGRLHRAAQPLPRGPTSEPPGPGCREPSTQHVLSRGSVDEQPNGPRRKPLQRPVRQVLLGSAAWSGVGPARGEQPRLSRASSTSPALPPWDSLGPICRDRELPVGMGAACVGEKEVRISPVWAVLLGARWGLLVLSRLLL